MPLQNPTRQKGFVYLTAVLDWASRRVLSWRLSNSLTPDACVEALEEAILKYGAPQIMNTDQGSQFTSTAFIDVLEQHPTRISMDGKGCWRDNVFIERLWKSVKYEEVYLHTYDSVSTAKQFDVDTPNRTWVGDITYIATDEGWLYLAGIKDLFNGELVGYAMAPRMTQNLVMQALHRAVATKRPSKGVIHHSDRGDQYRAHAHQRLLRQFGMAPSMSRKADCWDNAPMESF